MNPLAIFSRQPDNQDEEFSKLVRMYTPMAYRMAYQLTGGREDQAGDLVQEVFIKIWRQWDTCRPGSIKSWMYRVMQNLYIDSARRRTRHPAVSLDGGPSEESWTESLSDNQPPVDQPMEKAELQIHVQRALAEMDEEFRLPVVLCDMEGLAYEDIARILACPIGTVRSRIHRGRVQLRKLLTTMPSLEVQL